MAPRAINTAVYGAKADCTAGLDIKAAKTALQASVKTARSQYKDKIKQIEKRASNFQALLDAKNNAIKDANLAFKIATQVAKDALKLALGK